MADARLVDPKASFSSFSHLLDARILRALADTGFARPTLVQAKAIPLALEGRDILARARTGSGKTAAYSIPLVQNILRAKASLDLDDPTKQATRALILVPTKELSEQVSAYLRKLVVYCGEVGIVNLSTGTTAHLQRSLLADKPDIVVATPARALSLAQSKALSLANVESLVIDEADLILSYGHDDDVRQIFNGGYLPKVFQSFLMSATMTEDVEILKGLALRNPAILRLEEDEDEAANLSQYVVRCSEVDKFLLTYVILKLKLIKGKCILFVNDVERSYRLKLFLEQFSIKSCVLNSELPLNSRYHVVQEFNKGVYDYIIATDESGAQMEADADDEAEGDEDPEPEFTSTQRDPPEAENVEEGPSSSTRKRKRAASPPPKHGKRKHKKSNDKEYGVTRGIDFVDVACVLNFDLPSSSRSYTHRVGRTARAGRTGMALSFVLPKDQWGKNKVVGGVPSTKGDEQVFERIEKEQGGRGSKIKEYQFDMKQVEAFRYRMEDALRAVTRSAIKEARIKELKSEILNSEKLKAHFEDNPLDLEYLRHDKPLHPTRVQAHMKHVPKYLLPRIMPVSGTETEAASSAEVKPGFVPFKKEGSRGRGRGRGRGGRGGGGRGGKRKSDPLKKHLSSPTRRCLGPFFPLLGPPVPRTSGMASFQAIYLISSWLNLIFYTVEVALYALYMLKFRKDRPIHRWVVFAALVSDTICTIGVSAGAYSILLLPNATSFWAGSLIIWSNGVSSGIEHAFLTYRIWHLQVFDYSSNLHTRQHYVKLRNIWPLALLIPLTLVHIGFTTASGVLVLTQRSKSREGIICTLIGGSLRAATDIIIACILVYQINKFHTAFVSTQTFLRRFTVKVMATGIIAAVLTLLIVILLAINNNVAFLPTAFVGRVHSITTLSHLSMRRSKKESILKTMKTVEDLGLRIEETTNTSQKGRPP
ncbi:ATP-dependent DNA/RNA helicase [Pleurotus pulmonarius]|nr:ATP-dependent DNA/RNA helicase [Pleurotus pulmonarius]KAF4593397.1 ATP-dependent DNA/RNA helicase [Pleurotus pulmonarius]